MERNHPRPLIAGEVSWPVSLSSKRDLWPWPLGDRLRNVEQAREQDSRVAVVVSILEEKDHRVAAVV